MSTNNYYGDNVNIHGGHGHTGMIKNQVTTATPVSPELQAAIEQLLMLIRELRAQVPQVSAEIIDDSLQVITTDAATPPRERHRALMAITGVATAVGAVGQPVVDAVNQILALLSA
ncbi:hypothetical protein [Streptomyces sp. NPDC048581]|uniref:hypothetical protein n=1 Tax=unclassified Streptomyces TaxID=2593676 RepID=UPI003724B39F